MIVITVSVFITILCVLSSTAAVNYIWWEGEKPIETNFPASVWFNGGAIEGKQHLLSGGTWLANDGDRSGAAAFAKYSVDVPQAGQYEFCTRKFWKHGPFEWRFDDQTWRVCSRDVALADSVEIAKFLSANWVSLGSVELAEGTTTFELRLLAGQGESETACFDCFLLTQIPFAPRGKLKPDERSGDADEGFFAWEPELDAFTDKALLDLRYLNEDVAGMHGFVQHNGDRFLLGDGTPVKFWAVNLSSGIAALNRSSIDYMARRLAKSGVNMVRYHSPLFDTDNVDKVSAKKLDDLFYLISTLKKNGIYTTLSFYFPLWFKIKPEYGIEGYDDASNKIPFALLYFDERMQQIYKSWARQLLTTNNPYTGLKLADEPSAAIVEIINEDSYFFWTFGSSNIPKSQWTKLETIFGHWLIDRYGSLDQAPTAWGGAKDNSDDFAAGIVHLFDAWNMTGDAVKNFNPAKVKRIGDQVRFLTEHQRAFYSNIRNYFKDDLGSKSLISASNWHVTDPNMLDALERYTYTAGDVIDTHGYFGGEHTSPDGRHSYSVSTGHTFENLSALKVPEQLPLQFMQTDGFPQIISEIGWINPNLYRADYAFLASAYGALQGVDGFYTFALGGTAWDTSMKKFALSCPVILGNFPAYALMYRRSDVTEADAVIHQIVDLEDLYQMKGSGGSAAQALDDLRLKDIPPGQSTTGDVNNIDPLAFYVGKVIRSYGSNTEDSVETNFAQNIDRQNKIAFSQTGELSWHYGDGYALIDTAKSKGAAGFGDPAKSIAFKDNIVLNMKNKYSSILLISLDDQPIKSSNNILIQTMTIERPYGFKTSGVNSGTIKDMGTYPFGVEKIDVDITLGKDFSDGFQLIPLDENGYSKGVPIDLQRHAVYNDFRFKLTEDAVYHVLRRKSISSVNDWAAQERSSK